MVFQDYALFPHLDVAGNVGFGLRDASAAGKQRIIEETLDLVGLSGLAHRYPHELSGGQQQRVALARALAPNPDLILLDEPFSNLDVELRERLSGEVRAILKRRGTTAVLVTHDQHEAFALGDMVGVMRDGRLLQWDTPYNLYHEPNCRFVADFIGHGVFLPGTLLAPDTVETEIGVHQGNRAYDWGKGAPIEVLLRPDDIVPDPAARSRQRSCNAPSRARRYSILCSFRVAGGCCRCFPRTPTTRLANGSGSACRPTISWPSRRTPAPADAARSRRHAGTGVCLCVAPVFGLRLQGWRR